MSSGSEMDASTLRRTVRLAVSVASVEAFPERGGVVGGQAVGHGYLYKWRSAEGSAGSDADIAALQAALTALIARAVPIESATLSFADAEAALTAQGQIHALELLRSRVSASVPVVRIGSHVRLAHGAYLSSTALLAGLVHIHPAPKIRNRGDGTHYTDIDVSDCFVASYGAAEEYHAQPAVVRAMAEHARWGGRLGVRSVGTLNGVPEVGRGRKELILQSEFRQEQQLAGIVDEILSRGKGVVRLVAIAGPSSSGKTTFSHKLKMYLRNHGVESCVLSVDHYYLNLADQPRYKVRQCKEDVNYDSIEAMDVPLVNQHITQLIAGEEVLTPVYSMKTNNRVPPGKPFCLPDRETAILIIEGIHALAPEYTSAVPDHAKYRVYISPLTALQLDDHNAVKSTQHRMLRRMSRDYLFRGHTASQTLRMWANVRKGEHDWIFPHQNNTDVVLNSAAEYELPVLKTLTESILRQVPPTDPNYAVGAQVLHLLNYVASWPTDDVPPAALLREFIGNGAFDEH
eukprot:TRINITY_DN350_c0_g1_i1.p2 TRINITY_DN350_c0_g1~~TRINITY_DN350_c0_g1_i1.p2  ORF type:complete len:516 (+),score=81.55 TRINITY_DN350_c0_g1_i1:75-1622(+)